MPDVMSAKQTTPILFTQIAAVLNDGEKLLGSIPPDKMSATQAQALDKFSIAKGLLGQLQSCVNVLTSGNEPEDPPNDHDLSRGDVSGSSSILAMFPTDDDGRPVRNRHV